VSTTHDVDAINPTIGSIDGVGTMEGVITTSDNKNDLGSLLHPSVDPTPQLPHMALRLE
jgi:hypothetical protein